MQTGKNDRQKKKIVKKNCHWQKNSSFFADFFSSGKVVSSCTSSLANFSILADEDKRQIP